MDAIKQLFQEFVDGKIEAINRTVTEGRAEGPLLEFKLADKNNAPMTDKSRQLLAEALSGFANSDGGVIVWGVHAKPDNANDPDVAKKLQPIRNLKRFLSDLNSYTPQIVSPPIVGVEHVLIEDPVGSDSGYAVTYVPKSEGEPHMARAKEQHRYYFRSGSSFFPMESFMVADRYSRRPQPKLELAWRVERGVTGGSAEHPIDIEIHIVVGIRNIGRGIALYPAIVLFENTYFKLDQYGLDGNGKLGIPERRRALDRSNERKRFFTGGVNDAIHPGTILEVTRTSNVFKVAEGGIDDRVIKYELYCDGFSGTGEQRIPLMDYFRQFRGF